MSDSRVLNTLAASGQSDAVHGVKVDITLYGTWAGTVELQRYIDGEWVDTGDSWTANDAIVVDGVTPYSYRLDFTRSSGTLEYDLNGALP